MKPIANLKGQIFGDLLVIKKKLKPLPKKRNGFANALVGKRKLFMQLIF